MDLLSVSKESALTEAGNSVLTLCIFQGILAFHNLWACILYESSHSSLTQLKHKFICLHVGGEWWSLTQNSAISRAMNLSPGHQTQWQFILFVSPIFRPFQIVSSSDPNKLIGLVEYKAPVYQMYDCSKVPHGIPRNYMAQVSRNNNNRILSERRSFMVKCLA